MHGVTPRPRRGLAFSEWIAPNSGLWSNYCGDIVNTMDLTYTSDLNSISCKITPQFSKYIVRKNIFAGFYKSDFLKNCQNLKIVNYLQFRRLTIQHS